MIVSDLAVAERLPGGRSVVIVDLLGGVWSYPLDSGLGPKRLFEARYPSTVAVSDLDGDGTQELLVGELGARKFSRWSLRALGEPDACPSRVAMHDG